MPIDFRATTSNPSFGRAVLPSSQVGQYVNQQIIRNPAAGEARRNLVQPQAAPTTRESASVAVTQTQNPSENWLGNAAADISSANKRLMGYSQQAKSVRDAQAAKKATTGGQNYTGGTGKYPAVNTANLKGSRAQVIAKANSYLGRPYVYAGNDYNGIDCSGLTQQVYRSVGLEIPRIAAAQRDQVPGIRTKNIASLQPGDLIAWDDGSHVAVYAGNGEIIAAATPQLGVIRERVWGNVTGIKLRFPGE